MGRVWNCGGVLEWLQRSDRSRELYTCGSGKFSVTYSNREAPSLTRAEVDQLVAAGYLKQKEGLQVYLPRRARA